MVTEKGMKVRFHLLQNNMTQQELARIVGITPSYLSDLLRGKKDGPKAQEKMKFIMKTLGIKE